MLGYITAQAIVYGLIHVSKYQICTVLLAWAKKSKLLLNTNYCSFKLKQHVNPGKYRDSVSSMREMVCQRRWGVKSGDQFPPP